MYINITSQRAFIWRCPRKPRATGFFFRGKDMARVSFFIDGFNLYHALDNDVNLQRFKWLNFRRLAELYLRGQDTIADIFYFTALAHWDAGKVSRHKLFIQAQESFDVKTIYGKFKKVSKRCDVCGKNYKTHEEKQTDVNIAIKLFEQAKSDTYDNAVILSGDSDQVPAIRATKANFPSKRICVLVPPGRHTKLLQQEADLYSKIKPQQLASALLPDEITLTNGKQIRCPLEWK
jgi:uncharacterized LabA/DUF88 family protein